MKVHGLFALCCATLLTVGCALSERTENAGRLREVIAFGTLRFTAQAPGLAPAELTLDIAD